MSDIASKHDKFIRMIMADKNIAIDYFKTCLPAEISAQLDFTTLTQLPESYVSEELKETISDIVYSCGTKNESDDVRVTLLVEHKSYVDKSVPIQIGSYVFSGYRRQWQNDRRLSVIIPVLLYHGKDKWEHCTLSGMFNNLNPLWSNVVPDFYYIYHDLNNVSTRELTALSNRYLGASLLMLKHFSDRDWLASNVRMLLEWSLSGSEQLRIGFGCYLGEQGMDMKKIREIMEKDWTVKQIIEYFGTDDIPQDSIVGYFIEQGREEGLERGREQGLERGREQGLEQGREQGLEQGREQGREQGLEQGREEEREQAARNMIRKGYSDADICEVLEVTTEFVSRIRAETASA